MQKLRTSNLLLLVISLVLGCTYKVAKKRIIAKVSNAKTVVFVAKVLLLSLCFGGDNCEINLSCQGVNCQNGGMRKWNLSATGFGGDNSQINLSCQFIE